MGVLCTKQINTPMQSFLSFLFFLHCCCCSQPFYHLLAEVSDWGYDASQPPVAATYTSIVVKIRIQVHSPVAVAAAANRSTTCWLRCQTGVMMPHSRQ
jgi:hypothetical protein